MGKRRTSARNPRRRQLRCQGGGYPSPKESPRKPLPELKRFEGVREARATRRWERRESVDQQVERKEVGELDFID